MKRVSLLLLITFASIISFSQVIKTINLADGPIKISEPIQSGQGIVIKILNRTKANNYEIIINRVAPQIPPFESVNTIQGAGVRTTDCEKLEEVYNKMLDETTEAKIPQLRKELNELVKKTNSGCAMRLKAIQLEQELDLSYDVLPLKKGEVLEVTVRRTSSPVKEWLAAFNTGSKGVWKTSYGFAFAPTWISKEKKYYLDIANVITLERDRKRIDYIPAIFFNWFPAASAANDFSVGFSGGLGISFNVEPAVFLGISFTYNHNISVNLGFATYRQSFLKGRYNTGETINENNFDEETGLHQKLFRINPFIGISFRFGTNPFKTEE